MQARNVKVDQSSSVFELDLASRGRFMFYHRFTSEVSGDLDFVLGATESLLVLMRPQTGLRGYLGGKVGAGRAL